jgi:hypothetical protein
VLEHEQTLIDLDGGVAAVLEDAEDAAPQHAQSTRISVCRGQQASRAAGVSQPTQDKGVHMHMCACACTHAGNSSAYGPTRLRGLPASRGVNDATSRRAGTATVVSRCRRAPLRLAHGCSR